MPYDASPLFYEAFHFDDNEPTANALAALVLSGQKRATAGLHWRFFSRECERLGRVPNFQMPVVCERFKVVYPVRGRGGGEDGAIH